MSTASDFDVIVIGAGPSGAVASALLAKQGYQVLVLERQQFPRFSIGESLLPQCMRYIEEAGMLEAVQGANFQYKNGAAFLRRGEISQFNFAEKFTEGWGDTFQVKRAEFDHLLATEAEKAGADIRYQHEITAVDFSQKTPVVTCRNPEGQELKFSSQFVLDASGFGRVLPRLLDLESPSDFPVRGSLFTHIEDNIDDDRFDREKILVTVHPEHKDVWFWLIPFSDGRASIGVVAEPDFLKQYDMSADEKIKAIVCEDSDLAEILANAKWDTPVREITGYSVNVSQLCSDKFALLGNAGEFLDPVFSSGVTIAMRSASMAVTTLVKQLQGEAVNWQEEYAEPLNKGVQTFKTFVSAWYDGRFQDVIFHAEQSGEIREMICSILAGYAWDEKNPYVEKPERRLNVLAELCKNG